MNNKILILMDFKIIIVIFQLIFISKETKSSKLFYIYWNTSNSIFRIDKNDYIIDVNKGNAKFDYDQVNIFCPRYSRDTKEEETETFMIYNVSREEYETCRITSANPKVIAVCNNPYEVLYFTITFRPFSPQPNALEFLPGKDYYFISTSSKDDLHLRIGGRCSTNNMKIMFKVCCNPNDNLTTSTVSSLYFSTTTPWHIYPVFTYPNPMTRRPLISNSSVKSKFFKDKERKLFNQTDKKMNEIIKNELSQKEITSSTYHQVAVSITLLVLQLFTSVILNI